MKGERRAHGDADLLKRVLRRSRLTIALEAFTRVFWPFGSFLAVVWAALAFGLAEALTRGQALVFLAASGIAAAILLIFGLRRFHIPTLDETRARIDETLPGRPLAALRDTPALGRDDPAALGVWAAHIARMRRLAADARPIAADLRLAARDPWALRLMALVLGIAALVFAQDRTVASVASALQPPPGADVATGPSFEGWAEPPAYTGRPTLYLPEVAADAPVSVPRGTVVTLRVYGNADHFALAETVSSGTTALNEAAPGIAAAEFSVTRSGNVGLDGGGQALGHWSFVMEPDSAPSIRMTGPLERAPSGETRLPYEGHDDHGITAARANIALDFPNVDRRFGLAVAPDPKPALTVDLPLPVTGNGETVTETLVEDYSKNPLAGLPVTVTLTAVDAIGQAGTSEVIRAELPMRRFYDPMAAALVEQRRDLLWSTTNARRIVQVLRAVTVDPDRTFDSPRAYLVVRTAIRRLDAAERAGDVSEVQDEIAEALWQAAVQIEDGNLGDAKERLARAKERLEEALKGDASDDEIAQLMDELRQATRDYMEQMAREAIERGDQQQAQIPPGQTMTQDQIQELMDRIQELSEQGRKAEAQALLEMLQQMLENMQMMAGQPGEGQQGEGQQSMQGLADTLREQQGLADESFQQLQREFREGRGQPGDAQPGEGERSEGRSQQQGQPGSQQSLAERQEALRELMEEMQRGLPGEAGEAAREALRDAERQMGEARDGLKQGDTSGALDSQADAIDQLREGMRQMGEDLRRADGSQTGDQGQLAGENSSESGRDPLGRPVGSRGSISNGDQLLGEGDIAARARQLLDEIRRRTGDQARPQIELDYLKRLLDLF